MYGYDGFDDYGFHPAIVGGGPSKPEKDAEKQAWLGDRLVFRVYGVLGLGVAILNHVFMMSLATLKQHQQSHGQAQS